MTTFLRLLADGDKAAALAEVCSRQRAEGRDPRVFEVPPEAFDAVPGRPFAYWVSEATRATFERLQRFEGEERLVKQGLATADDFRFLRCWWENPLKCRLKGYPSFAKGGVFSPFYAEVYLTIDWRGDGAVLKGKVIQEHGNVGKRIYNEEHYFRPGLTWPRRTNGLSFRVMPTGCIFGDKGPAAFVEDDDPEELLALVSLLNSKAFGLLVSVQLARVELAQSFEVGLIQQTPVPDLSPNQRTQLATLARRAWSLKRSLDTVTETSHAFLLPAALRWRDSSMQKAEDSETSALCLLPSAYCLLPSAIHQELARLQAEIDDIAFDLYGFSDADRAAALGGTGGEASDGDAAEDADAEADEDEVADDTPSTDALLSWAIGVAFGRFDIRLATGERAAPPEPEPFDPLPAKSPGMLPDGDAPFHAHAGILVDDPGHAHDLVRITERVLERVDMPVPAELRRWLQKDFFPFHLQRYSKSRRKAPIYWPLATASGSYTLWLYYSSLTSQTLYTAINDFVEPKLAEVETEAATLRTKGSARSRDEETRLEALATLQAELRDLRDQLQSIAPQYQPKHDDGVQITAAPLWPLFRHKPWQKVLKDTWAKLEKGDYDWAHLAMTYWPERVREKCRHDKSLAIAHGLEELYVEPPAVPKGVRGRKKKGEIA